MLRLPAATSRVARSPMEPVLRRVLRCLRRPCVLWCLLRPLDESELLELLVLLLGLRRRKRPLPRKG